MASAEFWHRLMAAELSPAKAEAVVEEALAGEDPVERLFRHPALTDTERSRARAASLDALTRGLAAGARVLLPEAYPEPLALAESVPPALFVRGESDCLAAPTVAIVGTRGASTYGKACAQKFAQALAAAGATVVSGGALGIDAAAHKGALAVGGKTAAVLATGVDHVYPALHAGLFGQIAESGCLVSPFALGARPNDYKFLLRNDLVAALSLAVLVVESPQRSGALRTARAAADLGREVFVIPGDIGRESFWGSHALIRDGATLVDHPDAILESLGIEAPPPEAPLAPASSAGERILHALAEGGLPTDVIVERSGLETAEALSELTMLELEGRIVRGDGGYMLCP